MLTQVNTKVNTIQDYFDTLPEHFDSSAATGINAVFQYNIKEKEAEGVCGGRWYVIVNDGKMEVHEGKHPHPTVRLKMAADKYLMMVNGELDGRKAVMKHQLRLSGDTRMAIKMQDLFPQCTVHQQAEKISEAHNERKENRTNVERVKKYVAGMIKGKNLSKVLNKYTSREWFTHASPKFIKKEFKDVTYAQDGEHIFFGQLKHAFSKRVFILNRNEAINENEVVINYTIKGIHDKDYFFDVQPSHKEEKINGTAILRFEKGKIVEHWGGPSCETCTGYVA